MDYVKYIRNLVGKSAVNITGVNVIIFNENHEILLQKRGEYPTGKWGLIGGIVELGESLEDAAVREAKEETNLDIKDLKLFGTTSGKEAYMQFPNGDETYFISIGFCTHNFSGQMQIDGRETLDLKFYSYDCLPENLPKTHREMIDKFIDFMKN